MFFVGLEPNKSFVEVYESVVDQYLLTEYFFVSQTSVTDPEIFFSGSDPAGQLTSGFGHRKKYVVK
jgi:hypothetical protein